MNGKTQIAFICGCGGNIEAVRAQMSLVAEAGFDVVLFKGRGIDIPGFEAKEIDQQVLKNKASTLNFILRESKSAGYDWLFTVSENAVFTKKPGPFLDDLKNLMTVFGFDVWLSTTTDKCNYFFNKYNPRLKISFDEKFARAGSPGIVFTSHANYSVVGYDLSKYSAEMLFEEKYNTPMFQIVSFFARRRKNLFNPFVSMNMYPTSMLEKDFLTTSGGGLQVSNEQLKKDNEIFKQDNLPTTPDNDLNTILQNVYEKVKNI